MKKSISTIVAIVLLTSILANTAYAGHGHRGGINPFWVPVAVLSTLAAVTIAQAAPPVYERRVYYEPPQSVVYEEPRPVAVYREPRHYRHISYYDREPDCYYNERESRHHDSMRYSDYR